MASSKPGPLGKDLLNFGLQPGPLSWLTTDTPGALGRNDLAAPDFSFIPQPLAFDLGPQVTLTALKLVVPIFGLGGPAAATANPYPLGMIPESNLTPCATQAETDFKHKVYLLHVARARKVRSFFGGVDPNDLAPVENGQTMRKDAADACKKLLADVRSTLATQQAAQDPHALQVKSITLLSGYRSPKDDFRVWDGLYQGYFKATAAARHDFSDASAEVLVAYIAKYKAAPGFSNHTRGEAFDIGSKENNTNFGADRSKQADYAKTWLYDWLVKNAGRFDFKPIPTEVWHWEYKP